MFWKKKPPPSSESPPKNLIWFNSTELQIGDECVCVNDTAHNVTHQKLLTKGEIYIVREIVVNGVAGYSWVTSDNCGGPWIKVKEIFPLSDVGWSCMRFKKVKKIEKKSSLEDWLKKPTELDIEKTKEEAY